MQENFRTAYIEEAYELLSELEYSLLELEKESNADDSNLIAKVFRALHTIKGSSGMFGFNEIALFIHDIETLYDHIRNGEIKITQEIISLTLSARDRIGEMLKGDNKLFITDDQDSKDILTSIRNIIKEFNDTNNIIVQNSEDKPANSVCVKDTGSTNITYHIHFQPLQDFCMNGTNPVLLLNELRRLGPSNIIGNVDCIPSLKDTNPSKCYTSWDILLTTSLGIDAINEVFIFVDETKCILDIKLLHEHGELNNKSAHKMLGQLLIAKHKVSKEDIDEIILKTKQDNNDGSNEILPDFKKLEKLKEIYRNSGLTVLIDEIRNIVAEINEYIIRLEGDSKNQDYLYTISRLLWLVIDISNYINFIHTVKVSIHLEKLIFCFIDKPSKIDSEAVELFIQGIDYLNEILDNASDNTTVESKDDFIGLIDSLITQLNIYNKENPPELSDTNEGFDNNLLKKLLADPKTAAFLNQINQYKEMILNSMEDFNFNDEKLKILERLLNNLENAAKYMKHGGLLLKVQDSKNIVRNGIQDEAKKNIYSLIQYLSALISGEIMFKVPEVNLTEKDEGTPGTEDQKKITNKKVNDNESNNTNEKPKTAVEVENKTMRVDEYKIDNFSNMIGELVIAKNSYEYLLSEVFSKNNIEQSTEKKLNDNLHLLSRLTDDLQVGIITLRMIPLKSIFQKYSRVIRDISKKQNKKIEFVTVGNETEVDKKIADSLSDPLIHIIRNSCDHGIEVPEERVKLGKPETGTILLKASIEGGQLIIVINDDGKGLDRKKIYAKAQKMGIDTGNYDDQKILDLIFEPGFSTKTEVSELSGRGVGMDVVRTTIDKLGGSINIKTEENIGTEITFVIPMSIGLSDSLIVEANGETYALPVQSVLKTLKLEPAQFSRLHDRLMFNHRGEVIPTTTLAELLNGKSEEVETQLNMIKEKIYNNELEEIPIVIIRTKKGNYGIIVNKLMKNIELSIKPVPECIAKSGVISGVSILGDGNVVLVLNPDKMI
ncbi:MAG: chemotaxis protein CheW [Ignavibacteriaceae bacterium]